MYAWVLSVCCVSASPMGEKSTWFDIVYYLQVFEFPYPLWSATGILFFGAATQGCDSLQPWNAQANTLLEIFVCQFHAVQAYFPANALSIDFLTAAFAAPWFYP